MAQCLAAVLLGLHGLASEAAALGLDGAAQHPWLLFKGPRHGAHAKSGDDGGVDADSPQAETGTATKKKMPCD